MEGDKSTFYGNQYQNFFEVWHIGKEHIFEGLDACGNPIDSQVPICEHCSCRIIGQGVELENGRNCCTHCARQEGHMQAREIF